MSNTLTIRVPDRSQKIWKKKAEAAGWSLSQFMRYVLDRAEIKVTRSRKMGADGEEEIVTTQVVWSDPPEGKARRAKTVNQKR